MLISTKMIVMGKKTPGGLNICRKGGNEKISSPYAGHDALLFVLATGGCFKLTEGGALGNEGAPVACPPYQPVLRSAAKGETLGRRAYKRAVNESARDIPVAYNVDVLIVGGTSGGVAAAVEAAQKGATVFLAAPRPYLGQDLCGTYRLGRNSSLRELILARVLYRCGDYEGLGEKILREYARDLRAVYRRHAQTVLAEKLNIGGKVRHGQR